MASSKRPRHDENRPFRFVDQSTPVPKRPRLKAQPIVLAEVCNIQIRTVVCKGLFAGIDCVFASADSVG